MADRVRHMPVPEKKHKREMEKDDYERIARRRQALELLRKQADIAAYRLKIDIFNLWRTGSASQAQLADASGYSELWIHKIIDEIKQEPERLEEAIREWIRENPNKSLNGKLDHE